MKKILFGTSALAVAAALATPASAGVNLSAGMDYHIRTMSGSGGTGDALLNIDGGKGSTITSTHYMSEIAFSADERPVVSLTDEGLRVMRAEREPRLLLPPQAPRAARGGLTRPSQSGTAAGPAVGELALDADSETLFAALRAYRLELAKEQGVPPYVIASDRTLRDMALLKPRTYADLLAVHGIGPTKAERYGEGLLAVVNA